MSIELLEAGTMASASVGWLGSRSIEEVVSAETIAAIDASVNELPTALFYFRDMMILERELCVTPRNHVIWARTSRVDDARLFTTPREFAQHHHTELKNLMQHLHDDGVHQDNWRMHLPLCALTSWTARLSYRDAVRLVRYLLDVADYIRVRNVLLAVRLDHTATELSVRMERAFGLPRPVIADAILKFKTLPVRPLDANAHFEQRRQIMGKIVSLELRMPVALRAQLVRHREITIADGLVDLLNEGRSEQRTIGALMPVQAVALDTTWRAVLGKRTCWMAQADLWAPIAQLYGSATDGLPCADGTCPYAEDARQRLAGNDPGAPCPRYANLTATPLNNGHWNAAYSEAKQRPDKALWFAELGVKQETNFNG